MSENIQSISQGTFTIGSTSATNFQAGPGISITQPTEGTVRIANDETVIWTNDGSFSAKDLTAGFSEPASAFERLMFVLGTDIQSKTCSTVEYHPGSASLNWSEFYSNGFRYWQTMLNLGDNGMTAGPSFMCKWTYSTATTAWTKDSMDWQYNYQGIKKVIGINRKEV